ncbi:MAG TPA: PP2C family protein-serine/threonine phosphatase [Acidimicrobiales bacterium]|nr:PP2C family protein-serine/threonine phosphatase [Acidimicrobiales bacterium]
MHAPDYLGPLLDASHQLAPHALASAARSAATVLGATDLTIYLVDYTQRVLIPLPDVARPDDKDRLDIDSTMAGRSYRHTEVLTSRANGAVRLWVPLLDGAERLGVVELTLEHPDDDTIAHCRRLVSLLGQLVVTKSLFGDYIELARRDRPLELAAEFRWTLVPPLTFANPRVGVAGILEPAYEVAGDAFDYALNGSTLHLAVIDAMGHGLEAARLASLAVVSYRHARRLGEDLEATYRRMDDAIAEQFGDERFVTAQLATLGTDTGRLTWLNAGHPHPLLLRRGTVIGELEGGEICLPIGLCGTATPPAEYSLEPGDAVVFFSDGVVEARSPEGELFGERRLADHLSRAASSQEQPAEMMRRLAHAVLTHQQADLRDDATLLYVEWKGAPTS